MSENEEKPESERHACEDKPPLILFGPEPVHVPFGTEYKHVLFAGIRSIGIELEMYAIYEYRLS